jgi:hypothetical protein
MSEDYDSEANYLSDLGPHIGGAYNLTEKEEKEELGYLGI